MAKVYSQLLLIVCAVPDSERKEFGGLGTFLCRYRGGT
jgi:hypothetical protein